MSGLVAALRERIKGKEFNPDEEELTEEEIAERKEKEKLRQKREQARKKKELDALKAAEAERKAAIKAEKDALKPKRKVIINQWDLQRSISKVMEWDSTRDGYTSLGFYLFFVILYIVIVVMQMNIGDQYRLGAAIQSQFNNVTGEDEVHQTDARYLQGLSHQADFWNFLLNDGGLLKTIFQNNWYNGAVFSPTESGYLLGYDKLVGGLLVVQKRGKLNTDGCESIFGVTNYKQYYSDCYTQEDSTEDLILNDPDVGSAFNYSTSTGGYSFFFGVAAGYEKNLAYGQKLFKNRWTDKTTRKIDLKFAVYNGLMNSFAFVSMTFIYGITGQFVSGNNISYQSIVMEPYRTSLDQIRLALEIIFMLVVSQQMFKFFRKVYIEFEKPGGYKIFFNVNVILDAINLGLFAVFIILRVWVLWLMTENFIVVPTNKYEPILEQIAGIQNISRIGTFMNIFISLLRLFNFYSFQERLDVLNKTFANAYEDLYHFMIMFSIIFGSFGIMAHFLFGLSTLDYSSFGRSLSTLWKMMLGQFYYKEMESINPTMASVFFISFMFLVQMVLLNILLAILIEAYTEANNPSAESVFAELGMGVMRMYLNVRRSGLTDKSMLKALKRLQKQQLKKVTTAQIIQALPEPARVSSLVDHWPDLRHATAVDALDEFESTVQYQLKQENLIDQLDAVLQESTYMHRRVSIDPEVNLPAFRSVPSAKFRFVEEED